jgi:hypothetical protein
MLNTIIFSIALLLSFAVIQEELNCFVKKKNGDKVNVIILLVAITLWSILYYRTH